MTLTAAQRAAVEHVRALAGPPERQPDALITINFHPDRVDAGGRTVVEGLLADGRFRSQFETGISNGGLTAFPGGDRDRWEGRMFGGAYQRPGVTPADRPKYGALNLRGSAAGAAPRFGSAHLRLRPEVCDRATYTWDDSYHEPTEAGVADAFSRVRLARAAHDAGTLLDDYVEAQVHGPVDLATDVEAVVLDDSFAGTAVAVAAAALTARHGVPVEWRRGPRLAVDRVPADFRGPSMPSLAARVCAGAPVLDACAIGRAARAAASPEELQLLKYLWHCLVQYGQ
jgi:hypothetical protein